MLEIQIVDLLVQRTHIRMNGLGGDNIRADIYQRNVCTVSLIARNGIRRRIHCVETILRIRCRPEFGRTIDRTAHLREDHRVSRSPVVVRISGKCVHTETVSHQIRDRDLSDRLRPGRGLEHRAIDAEGNLVRIRDDRIQCLIVTSSKSGDYRRQTDEKL